MCAESMNEYLNNFVLYCNTRALTALGELAFVITRWEQTILVGRFCLLLFVCGICCIWACLVVAPWDSLRAPQTSAFRGLRLIFIVRLVS